MELRDLIVTPVVLIIIFMVATLVKRRIEDPVLRFYFLPALWVKIAGAICLGLIYQFYYYGGDTFNYHTYGSRVIWEAFVESPALGLKLLFSNNEFTGETFQYASRIVFFVDPSSFFVVRVAAVLDLFTFSTYSATAVLFAVVSFTGMWLLFKAFYSLFPELHKWLAFACFFIPSVFFWGSGVLKDTLTMAGLGYLVYASKQLFIDKRMSFANFLLLVLGFWLVFSIKKYVLLCFLPAILLWINASTIKRIESTIAKLVFLPFVVVAIIVSGYFALVKVSENDKKYSLDKIAQTAMITAYDIRYVTGKDAGSGYTLGELDGTISSMIKSIPAAINVTLFRPYLWEVNSPLMLLSAIESFALLMMTIFIVVKKGWLIKRYILDPDVLFCFIFSLTFSFAVGISTYNFGTLSRYKIPMLPFFVIGLAIIYTTKDKEEEVPVNLASVD